MKAYDEAVGLKISLECALKNFRSANMPNTFKESEVKFRYETIEGVLILLLNDMDRLCKEWEK